jgi:hypothetical protein
LRYHPLAVEFFKPEEFEPGADNVIVLSDLYWTRRFGSDPNIVGRKVQLDGKTVEIVGVMPHGFEHPILWGTVDIWQPLRFLLNGSKPWEQLSLVVWSSKPGVTIQQAEQSMVALAANLGKQNSSNER